MSVETWVLEYWIATQSRDRDRQQEVLTHIRPEVQQMLESIGFLWCDELETFLKICIINYSSSYQIPFMRYLVYKFCRAYRLNYLQEERLLQIIKK